jgi:ankyrin repeat protein
MADSLELEEGEIREELLLPLPTPPQLSRQLSSRYTHQGDSNTCSIHCCAKVVIRFMKTFLATSFIRKDLDIEPTSLNEPIANFMDDSADEQFERGNPCNVFYTEKVLIEPLMKSFESFGVNSKDPHKCTDIKELIHVILYCFIYKVLLNKFDDALNTTDSELHYICNFICICPFTSDAICEIVGIEPDYLNDNETASNALESVQEILRTFKDIFTGQGPELFTYTLYGVPRINILPMIKEHITDKAYYATVLLRSNDGSLAHYLTLEYITDDSIILKDSYGTESKLYTELGLERVNGILTIPFTELETFQPVLHEFTINILSADDSLEKKIFYNKGESVFMKNPVINREIDRLYEGQSGVSATRTILGDAIVAKYSHLCNTLLDNGASPNTYDGDDITPFLLSTRYPELNTITKKMIEKGADVTILGTQYSPESPFVNIASQDKNANGLFENVELFQLMLTRLDEVIEDPKMKNYYISFKARLGIPPNRIKQYKTAIGFYDTALKFAIYRNNVELCRLLIANDVSIHETGIAYYNQAIYSAIAQPQPNVEIILMMFNKNPLIKEQLSSSDRTKLVALAKKEAAKGFPELQESLEKSSGGGNSKRITRRNRKKRTRKMRKRRTGRSIKKRTKAHFFI